MAYVQSLTETWSIYATTGKKTANENECLNDKNPWNHIHKDAHGLRLRMQKNY